LFQGLKHAGEMQPNTPCQRAPRQKPKIM